MHASILTVRIYRIKNDNTSNSQVNFSLHTATACKPKNMTHRLACDGIDMWLAAIHDEVRVDGSAAIDHHRFVVYGPLGRLHDHLQQTRASVNHDEKHSADMLYS